MSFRGDFPVSNEIVNFKWKSQIGYFSVIDILDDW